MPESAIALVDTHCHLMDPQFRDDAPEVLDRACAAGVQRLVCVGYDLRSSRAAVKLAEAHPEIVATVGVHPNYAGQAGPNDFEEIAELATHPQVRGIGETGLDYYRQFSSGELQRQWLGRHLALAAELGLPVAIHCREASEDVADMLTVWAAGLGRRSRPPGVLHCYGGDERLADRCLEGGFLISFAGPLTFKRTGPLVDAARRVPADRIVIETDAPYLAPAPRRGSRNEPALLSLTFVRLAEIRDVDPIPLARQIWRNSDALFRLEYDPYGTGEA